MFESAYEENPSNLLNQTIINRRQALGLMGAIAGAGFVAATSFPSSAHSEISEPNVVEQQSKLLSKETINGVEYKRYVVTSNTHTWLNKDTIFETREDASAPCDITVPIGIMVNGMQIIGEGSDTVDKSWFKNGDFDRKLFEHQYGLPIINVTNILKNTSGIPAKNISKIDVRIDKINASGQAGYIGEQDICPSDNITNPYQTYIALNAPLVIPNSPLKVAEIIGTIHIHEFFHAVQAMGGTFPEENRADKLTDTMPRESMASMFARHWFQKMQDKNDENGRNLVKAIFGEEDDSKRGYLKAMQTNYEYLAVVNLWISNAQGALVTSLPNGMNRGYSIFPHFFFNGLGMSTIMQKMNLYCTQSPNINTFADMARTIDPTLPTDYLSLSIMSFEEMLFDINADKRPAQLEPSVRHYADAVKNMSLPIDHEQEYIHNGAWLKPTMFTIDLNKINTIIFENGGDHVIAAPGIGQDVFRITESGHYQILPNGIFLDPNGKARIIIYDNGTSANQSKIKFTYTKPIDPNTLNNKVYLPTTTK